MNRTESEDCNYPNSAGSSEKIRVTDIPEHERPIERVLMLGTKALRDAELVAIVLGTGTRETGVLDFADLLLSSSGGVRGLLASDADSLLEVPGIGKAKAARILAVRGLLERFYTRPLDRGERFSDPRYSSKFFMAKLCDLRHEVFGVAFLDGRHRLLRYVEMFQGTINAATVHPREVIRLALQMNAAAVIVAHNHPSGNPTPSDADRHTTRLLSQALRVSGIKLLDHIVVGETDTVSFAEENEME